MTDVMENNADSGSASEGFDDRQLQALVAQARAEGLQLTDEGGLLARLTKLVVESALEGEMDDHLGYAKNDPAGRDGGNSRNGKRVTVLTEAGPVQIAVPVIGTGSSSRSWLPNASVA